MDWLECPQPQLWVLPKGVKRKAMAKPRFGKQFSWQSKYSSVITSALASEDDSLPNKRCTSDGMNNKGLTANLLWLTLSDFPKRGDFRNTDKKPMSLSIWAQYILDTCKNVSEAIKAMEHIYIQTSVINTGARGGTEGTCHLSVGDRAGNSVVFEYIDQVLHIYTNVKNVKFSNMNGVVMHAYTKQQMQVMTNDPAFDRQIASLDYWDELNKRYQVNGNPAMLPGSNASLSRFIRATYFTEEMNLMAQEDQKDDHMLILARLAAVMNNAAQPATRLRSLEETPANLSRTQYNSFADQTRLQYFYRSGYSPFMIWVYLSDFKEKLKNLREGQVYKLTLDENGVYRSNHAYHSGNVTDDFKIVDMFEFIPADQKSHLIV